MRKILLLFVFLGVVLAGCKEEFLDVYPTTEIDENAAFESQDNSIAVLYGIYDYLFDSPLLGSFMSVVNEVRGDDAFLAQVYNWSWWLNDFNYTWTASAGVGDSRSPRNRWDMLYSVIENTNSAISADLPFVGEDLNEYLAEMKMLRAMSYYYLVTQYCAPYTKSGGPASPGVPLYEVSNASVYKGRGTVQDVYDLIDADLLFARTNTPVQLAPEPGATRFNRCFANGLSARVALSKGDYTNALIYAEAAIADAPALATGADYLSGFSSDNEESIFIIPFNSDDYPIYWGLTSFYDHPEGYGNIFFTKDLFDSYAADDLRKEWFVTPLFYNMNDGDVDTFYGDDIYISYHYDGYYSSGAAEAMDFYTTGSYDPTSDYYYMHYRPGHYSLYAKFPRMDANPGSDNGSVGLAQPAIMRTSEMWLIKAECEARGEVGGDAAAQTSLFEIQSRASATAVKSVNTSTDLLDEVLYERRKELAGEGFRMLDIMRLGIPLVRPNIAGPNWSAVMNLPAYADEFLFPIPEAEIDSNTELTEADQNPGYSAK